MPQVVDSPSIEPRAVQPVLPTVVKPKPRQETIQSDFPRDWLPPAQVEKQWTAIVIHHSATENGNAAIFDRMHREHNHWEGVGYDFVIGNGINSGDGQVEVTFRWQRQMAGAHCGGTPGNWANVDAVGICLVGNFNDTKPTTQQMESLLKLIRFLKKRYGISNGSIYGHKSTPGARITDCPGNKFPMARLKWLASS
ncbi:MAG: peptidoglycan recognition family protein [Sedimentisphaerales bacterium]